MVVIYKIIKESFKILVIASMLSTVGGVGFAATEQKIIAFLPFLILLPALSGMIGSFGTLISSKFTTMLFLGKVRKKWWLSRDVNDLFKNILSVAIISAVYLGVLASIMSFFKGYIVDYVSIVKIILVSLLFTSVLTLIILTLAVMGGLVVYYRNADPSNYLIPLTTAFADLGSFLLFSLVLFYFF